MCSVMPVCCKVERTEEKTPVLQMIWRKSHQLMQISSGLRLLLAQLKTSSIHVCKLNPSVVMV
jgi:hypothetical protein